MYTNAIYLLQKKQIRKERKLFSFIRMCDEYIILSYSTIESFRKGDVCRGVSGFNWL